MKQIFILGLSCLAIQPASAFQMSFRDTLFITEPVYQNLYLAGGNVIINAPIYADLIVAGGTVQINDTVIKDILLIAGNVIFNGYVGDDIRCAGANVQLLKHVAGDVVVSGGTIHIGKQSTIGNLYCGGGELVVDGIVEGTIKTASGNMVLNGTAMKDIDCRGGRITINGKVHGPATLAASDKLVIGDDAGFDYDVRYWIPDNEVDFKHSLNNSRATYDQSLKIKYSRWYYLGFSTVIGLLWYIGMLLLLISIVQYSFNVTMKRAAETAFNSTLKSFGYGIAFWVAVPVCVAIAFITFIGIPVGLILLAGYITLLLLATVIVSVVAANWLNNRANSKWSFGQLTFGALGIFVVLKILTFTPLFGWLILGILICITFGSIILNINWRKKQLHANK